MRYANNPFVWFGLVNEPHQQSALVWVKAAHAIAAAIRATGATKRLSSRQPETLKAYLPR
jgi:endoglucanase